MKENSKMSHYDLKKIRESLDLPGKKMSQTKFAKELGVDVGTLRCWEQNINPINEWASNLINLTADRIRRDQTK